MKVALAISIKRTDDESEAEFDTIETVNYLAGLLRKLGHDVK